MNLFKNMQRLLVAALGLLTSVNVMSECNVNLTLSKPSNIYTDHGDGTVTDSETGLMWMKCSLGQSGTTCTNGTASSFNWKQALEEIQRLNIANGGAGTLGHNDWRMPDLNELGSLVESACYRPSVNVTIFPATPAERWYWTASTFPSNGNSAFLVSFVAGEEPFGSKSDGHSVRLVRSGQ